MQVDMKQLFAISLASAVAVFTYLAVTSYKDADPQPDRSAQSSDIRKVVSPPLPTDLTFAGEAVPVDQEDVYERLDRELIINVYWPSTTLAALKRSGKYFPTIERILAEEGVPEDFKYLAVAESHLKNVISPAGARGVWQFMSRTGKHFGLEINEEVDERYHIEKATRAACQYLKGAHKKFGSWTLAAASYNMGEPRLERYLKEQQVSSYYDVHLSQETLRYVFRIIALKAIFESPNTYGFHLEAEDAYAPQEFAVVTTNEPITSLIDFAIKYGTTYRMLKVYNPWLLDDHLPNSSGKTYEIKVPK